MTCQLNRVLVKRSNGELRGIKRWVFAFLFAAGAPALREEGGAAPGLRSSRALPARPGEPRPPDPSVRLVCRYRFSHWAALGTARVKRELLQGAPAPGGSPLWGGTASVSAAVGAEPWASSSNPGCSWALSSLTGLVCDFLRWRSLFAGVLTLQSQFDCFHDVGVHHHLAKYFCSSVVFFVVVLIYVSAEGEWLLHLACLEIHGFSYLIVALLWFQ